MRVSVRTDVLVVGGGIAGWLAAAYARKNGARTVIADKGYIGMCGQSPYADSFFVHFPKGDSIEKILDRISRSGEYLTNRDWCRHTIERSIELYEELKSWGIGFRGDPESPEWDDAFLLEGCAKSTLDYSKTFGCKARNHLLEIGVELYDRVMITELLIQDGRVCGAVGIGTDNDDTYVFESGTVIMCTGGCGMKVPGYPMLAASTGDGERLAFEAGAAVAGKEFVQPFHSTAEDPAILSGKDLPPESPMCTGWVTKKVLFPSMWEHAGEKFRQLETHVSYYQMSYLDHELTFHNEGGPITCEYEGKTYHITSGAALGLAPRKADGIWPADFECRSTVPGLFAAGDTLGTMANGTVYGLGGTGMGGSAATGATAGTAAAKEALGIGSVNVAEDIILLAEEKALAPLTRKKGYSARWIIQLIQNAYMPYYVAYIKKEDRLNAALVNIKFIREHLIPHIMASDMHELRMAHEAQSIAVCTEIRLRSALFRTESRGMHYREDYPFRDDENWLAWTRVIPKDGYMDFEKVPVPEDWRPDPDLTYAEKYPYEFPGEKIRGLR